MRLHILAIGCLLLTNQALAKVYQYTDAHGNTVFTDSPPEQFDAKPIELPSINSLPAPEPRQSRTTKDSEPQQPEQNPYQLSTQLPTEEAIRANNGSFTVTVTLNPELSEQHRLQLLVDGQAHGEPSHSTQLEARNLDRGEHSIAVQVLSQDTVIQQSSAQTVNIQRTHINAPARRARP